MEEVATIHQPEQTHEDSHSNRAAFGFWVYLMTDLLTFGALFAVFAVLRNNTFGGVSGAEIFNLPFVLTETFILLTSSFTCGLAVICLQSGKIKLLLIWLWTTFILGASFLAMELFEFHRLITDGHGPQKSAFLSSFFTLVGTHGLHITVGLLWLLVLIITIIKRGLTPHTNSKLMRFSLFWHFLDIVWIFIFTVVYLMGVL